MSEIEAFLKKLKENPDSIKDITSYEEAMNLYKAINPYRQQINPNATNYTCISFMGMRDDHIYRIALMSVIGYLYRAHFEYEDLMFIPETVRKERKETIDKNKRVILDFLDCIFEYNPEKDVRTSYVRPTNFEGVMNTDQNGHPCNIMVNDCEPTRNDLIHTLSSIKDMDELQAYINTLKEKQEGTLNTGYSSLDGICDKPNCKCKKLSKFAVPSQDLFRRLTRYTDNNWKKIVKITSDLYADSIEIETAIQVHKHFKSKDSAIEYQEDNGIKSSVPIITVKDGPWVILTTCEDEVRDKTQYNKMSNELKDILNRSDADKKLGDEMLKKRTKKQLKKNIHENKGEYDRAGVEQYSSSTGVGNKSILTDVDKLELDEFAKLVREGKIDQRLLYENVDADGIPLDSVQVDVFEIKGDKSEKYPIYTKADWVKDSPDTTITTSPDNTSLNTFPTDDTIAAEVTVEED